MCVRRSRPLANPRPQHVITDLYIIYDSDGTILPPPGFYKVRAAAGRLRAAAWHPWPVTPPAARSDGSDAGWAQLPYDLNKGTSGNFVYLCYRLGYLDGPDDPVTDIVICADSRRTVRGATTLVRPAAAMRRAGGAGARHNAAGARVQETGDRP